MSITSSRDVGRSEASVRHQSSSTMPTRAVGLGIFAACFGLEVLVNVVTTRFAQLYSFGMVIMGVGLLGLLQAVTGVPFPAMAFRWSTLRPWQRGVISFSVVIGAIAVAVLVVWMAGR
jgi:hypothetical protein